MARLRALAATVALIITCLAGTNGFALECPPLVESTAAVETAGYSRGLLWRIDSEGAEPSYLFGTIHLGDPRVMTLPAAVIDALQGSNSFGMEVILDVPAVTKLSRAMSFDNGRLLTAVIEQDLFQRVLELLSRYGVDRQAANRLKPWAVYTTLSLPPGHPAVSVDLSLLSAARQQGKAVFGLESIEEQIRVFDNLPRSDQLGLLRQVVCHYEEMQAELEEVISRYLQRDLAGIMRMSMRYESPAQDRFMDVLLWQRNRRMVDRMLPYLEGGRAFIAIGTLHLPGVGGVLDLLNQSGYSVKAVY